MIAGLVLAAGDSRRFGAPKQLARLRGRPLLEHALAAMAAAPVDELLVVVGSNASAILREVDLHGARAAICVDWSEGQAASLKAGLEAVPEAEAVVVALGDQPFLSPRAVAAIIDGRGVGVDAVRASYDGVPGHPVLLERSLFAAVRRLHGDDGARALVADANTREVPCDGLGRPDDIDTREQLEEAS
jgi:molybdenum cofactor cytidylyltransferase